MDQETLVQKDEISGVLETEQDKKPPIEYVSGFKQREKLMEMFPDQAKIWEKESESIVVMYEDEKGMLGITHGRNDNLVSITGIYDENPYHETLKFEDERTKSEFAFFLRSVITRFPSEKRYSYLHDLIDNKEKIEKMTPIEVITNFADMLEEDGHEKITLDAEVPESFQEMYSKLANTLDGLSRSKFKKTIENDLHWNDPKPDDKERGYMAYNFALSEYLSLYTNNEVAEDIRNVTDEHERYPVEKFIKRKFDSVENLTKRLDEISKDYESIGFVNQELIDRESTRVEMVDLDNVVGSMRMDTRGWHGNESDSGRGPELIYKLTKEIEHGDFDIHKNVSDLLKVLKKGDKYYVSTGNHRMAALKAMGIEKAPLVVTNVNLI